MVDGEASESEHRKRIAREFPVSSRRQILDFNVRRSDGGVPEHASILRRDVRDTEMVAKLVLSREPLKEAVEVGVACDRRRTMTEPGGRTPACNPVVS